MRRLLFIIQGYRIRGRIIPIQRPDEREYKMRNQNCLTLLVFSLFYISLGYSSALAQDIFVKPSAQPNRPAADLGIGTHTPPSQQPAPQPAPRQVQQPTYRQEQEQPQPAPQQRTETSTFPGSSDLQIIKISEDKGIIAPGTGENVINVSAGTSGIGPLDKSNILQTLGLDAQQAAQNCHFEFQVIYSTDGKGRGGIINLGKLAAAQQRFSGNIRDLIVYPTLACKKIRKPISGTIIEQGDFYKIGSNPITCTSPNRAGPVSVSFRYVGDNQVECIVK